MLPGRQLTIDSLLRTLRTRRWLLIAPLVTGVLGGLLYSRSQPSLYRSDAVIQIVPQRVPESYVSATVTERVEDRLRAIAQQVLSRTQLEKLILDLDLFPEERRALPMEDVVQQMTARVTIEPLATEQTSRRETQSEAFRVSFDYEHAATAQKVAERLATFFIDTNARERGAQADQTSSFLEAQLADARTRLETQEQKLKNFRERNAGRLPTQMQANMQAIQNAQLALQATMESMARDRDRKLILERLNAEAATEEGGPSPPTAAPEPIDPATGLSATASASQRLEAALRALTQMELRLSDKHPDMIRLKRRIEDLERQVNAEALQRPLAPEASSGHAVTPEEARIRDRLREQRAEIESLNRQIAFKEAAEARLRGEIAAYQARLEAVPGVESEWVALTRDYDTLQASYRELLAKSENSKMAASLEQRQIGEQFRILDPPRAPQTPHSPNRARINLIASFAGLVAGLALVTLAHIRDATMHSEADIVGTIDLPVLALLPFVTAEEDLRRKRRRRWLEWSGVVVLLGGTATLVWFLQLWKFVR